MATAGPSRTRQSRSSEESPENGNGTQARKKRGIDDIFEKQDVETKQRLSRDYRELQSKADDLKANQANVTPGELLKQMKAQSKLFKNVRDTQTAALDAKLILTTTDTAMGLARKYTADANSFDIDEFIIRIKGQLGLRGVGEDSSDMEDELDESLEGRPRQRRRRGHLGDWEKIGWMAAAMNRRVPGIEFMYGPLTVEHKKRQTGQRQRRRELAPEVRPDEVQHQAKAAKDDTMSNVRVVMKVLDEIDPEGKGVNFFRLVLNPNDFGQTVENMFFLSFLIRDGRAGITVQPDGEIIIRREDPHDPETQGDVPRNQGVIELDMEAWEEAKKVFNIKESAIPHRTYQDPVPMAANRWY